MAINKPEFIVVINHYKKENNEEAIIKFLQDLDVSRDLAIFLVRTYWSRSTLGGSIWKVAFNRGIVFNTAFKKIEISYKVVPDEKAFAFDKPT